MNNLEKIKAAWAMGWAAQLSTVSNNELGYVIDLGESKEETRALVIGGQWFGAETFFEDNLNDCIITGYLYAGQLAGNEPIPEKQRFRVKQTGIIYEWSEIEISPGFILTKDKERFIAYLKGEIEPVFD